MIIISFCYVRKQQIEFCFFRFTVHVIITLGIRKYEITYKDLSMIVSDVRISVSDSG